MQTHVHLSQKKKGLINGLSKISWTLSSSLFNYMGLHIVNPEGKEVELYIDNGLSKNIKNIQL